MFHQPLYNMNPQTTNEERAERSSLQLCLARRSKSESQTSNTQKSKGGRPKKPEDALRQYPVKVYFDEANYHRLLNRSQRTGLSLSTIVYELAVNGYVREPISHDVLLLLRSLAGMANNLNQIAHEAHISHFLQVEKRARETASKIDDLLIRISEK